MRQLWIEDARQSASAREALPNLLFEYMTATGIEMGAAWADGVSLPARLEFERHNFESFYPDPGTMLVAFVGSRPVGCVGVSHRDGGRMELRRMWVRPRHRRTGVGSLLVQTCLEHARAKSVAQVVLDVLPVRRQVVAWYRSFGFTEIQPYADEPYPMVFLGLSLK